MKGRARKSRLKSNRGKKGKTELREKDGNNLVRKLRSNSREIKREGETKRSVLVFKIAYDETCFAYKKSSTGMTRIRESNSFKTSLDQPLGNQ